MVDLHVENATLGGVIARLRQILPTGSLHIEVRGDTPIKVSLDLKQVRVGDALSDLARLAGCGLYVLPDTLLIVPQAQLSPRELHYLGDRGNDGDGAEWLRQGNNRASGSKVRILFARAVTQEASGQNATTDQSRALIPIAIKTTFGAFSPESQAMLRELANHINEGNQSYVPKNGFYFSPIYLNADSPISIKIPNPGQIDIDFPLSPFDPSASASKAVSRGLGIMWNER